MNRPPLLHVLGCVPSLLELLFELAHDAEGYGRFAILKNIPVDVPEAFRPGARWNFTEVDCSDQEFILSEDARFAFSVVGTDSKPAVYEYFATAYGIEQEAFPALVHPAAHVSPSARLGPGAQIEQLSIVATGTRTGFGVNIKRGCSIGHHCTLEEYVTVNPGVSVSGRVHIGRRSMIGTGASVRDGVRIGKNCLIGVGSAVVDDIPDNSVAFGNPCRVRGARSA